MKRLLLAAVLAALAPWASAQIVIGQTTGLSGPEADAAKDNAAGAQLYFERVNASGGVNGQKIELVTLDDKADPKLSAANAKTLISENNAIALFMTRGTAQTVAVEGLLAENKVPLVAPASGAMVLRNPVNPWIFNARAPFQHETEKAVQHLASVGATRIAVAHVDDAFGTDATIGALRGFDKAHLRAAFVLKWKGDKPDMAPIVAGVNKLDIQALVLIGPSAAVADATRQLRAKGLKTTVATTSNNASPAFIKMLGDAGHGVIVTQVFPYERSAAASIVKEASDLASARGIADVTPAMLQGFAGAKVLVEGLKRAGPKPTRQKLRDALEGMNRVDIGGLEAKYSPQDHSGIDYAELSIIGSDGRFHR